MPLLNHNEQVTEDRWLLLQEGQPLPTKGNIILPLSRLVGQDAGIAEINSASHKLGVLISGDDNIQAVVAFLPQLQLVEIEIPVFTDGRGFSFARILRRAGFTGEIRATGDVTRDRLAFLKRCGFDAFDIPEERFSSDLDRAFTEISVRYQGAVDDPNPIYRQKAEG